MMDVLGSIVWFFQYLAGGQMLLSWLGMEAEFSDEMVVIKQLICES